VYDAILGAGAGGGHRCCPCFANTMLYLAFQSTKSGCEIQKYYFYILNLLGRRRTTAVLTSQEQESTTFFRIEDTANAYSCSVDTKQTKTALFLRAIGHFVMTALWQINKRHRTFYTGCTFWGVGKQHSGL
jgi:hypothetical protein